MFAFTNINHNVIPQLYKDVFGFVFKTFSNNGKPETVSRVTAGTHFSLVILFLCTVSDIYGFYLNCWRRMCESGKSCVFRVGWELYVLMCTLNWNFIFVFIYKIHLFLWFYGALEWLQLLKLFIQKCRDFG